MSLKAKAKSLRHRLGVLEPPYRAPLPRPEQIRPYFGTFLGEGGPKTRTQRMIERFGNYRVNPNIIYANSSKMIPLAAIARYKQKRTGVQVVMNQNGLYYPGWYSGDWKKQNEELRLYQHLSDYVIFQSEFCKRAYEELIGLVQKSHEVLLNSVPELSGERNLRSDRMRGILSGVFHTDADHILEPAIHAFEILSSQTKSPGKSMPVLVLAGYFTPQATQTQWFPKLSARMDALRQKGCLENLGSYDPSDLPEILSTMHFALHLKYKDPCPNAVVERMALGVPHIYSNSGGTPELIGETGIGLSVRDTWDEQVPVSVDELVSAIQKMEAQFEVLGAQARSRYLSHLSWNHYETRHIEIFREVLGMLTGP